MALFFAFVLFGVLLGAVLERAGIIRTNKVFWSSSNQKLDIGSNANTNSFGQT